MLFCPSKIIETIYIKFQKEELFHHLNRVESATNKFLFV